jgi:putative molybdopterin biosynthesis protein
MSKEMMNTKEVASYLEIHEKQVYALIKEGKIPSTKATGKWIFPKHIIDSWIDDNSRAGMNQAKEKAGRMPGALLAAGSNDPVLDLLLSTLRLSHPDIFIFSANTGSSQGLAALGKGLVDIAWSHLFDKVTGQYNIPFILKLAPGIEAAVVSMFTRETGIVTSPGDSKRIKGISDLGKKGVRIINRQEGSGTRLLLDGLISKAGIEASSLAGYDNAVFTHFEVGLAVLSGKANAGIATGSVASMLGLNFIPLSSERFDMVISRNNFFKRQIQALISVLRSDEFKTKVNAFGHYDFKCSGMVVWPEA